MHIVIKLNPCFGKDSLSLDSRHPRNNSGSEFVTSVKVAGLALTYYLSINNICLCLRHGRFDLLLVILYDWIYLCGCL